MRATSHWRCQWCCTSLQIALRARVVRCVDVVKIGKTCSICAPCHSHWRWAKSLVQKSSGSGKETEVRGMPRRPPDGQPPDAAAARRKKWLKGGGGLLGECMHPYPCGRVAGPTGAAMRPAGGGDLAFKDVLTAPKCPHRCLLFGARGLKSGHATGPAHPAKAGRAHARAPRPGGRVDLATGVAAGEEGGLSRRVAPSGRGRITETALRRGRGCSWTRAPPSPTFGAPSTPFTCAAC